MEVDETTRQCYEQKVGAWLAVEAIVKQLDKEKTANAVAKLSSESGSDKQPKACDDQDIDGDIENDVFEENGFSDLSDPEDFDVENIVEPVVADKLLEKPTRLNKSSTDSGNVPDEDVQAKCIDVIIVEKEVLPLSTGMELEITENCYAEPSANSSTIQSNKSSPSTSSYETVANDFADIIEPFSEPTIPEEYPDADVMNEGIHSPKIINAHHNKVIITNASIDIANMNNEPDENGLVNNEQLTPLQEEGTSLETLQEPKSTCVSPASSGGGVYSVSFKKCSRQIKRYKQCDLIFSVNFWMPLDLIFIESKRMCKDVIEIIGILLMKIWTN